MRKLSFLRHGECAGEKARHDLKRHVLECTGGTVPKLKRVDPRTEGYDGRGRRGKSFFRICLGAVRAESVPIVIGEEH